MKLFSRKAIAATVAAAAISTGALTAPAMAAPSVTVVAQENKKEDATKPANGDGSTDFVSGSSDFDSKKLKEVVATVSGIGSLLGAIITIFKNFDAITKLLKF
ncbi:hypothetical protein HW450_01250 [Corynebacterium hindlerae]|uniref:Secreted protein n=1 Tax=Corynebacterium hindlerae TaxID=699041 RepID=A0A7G5FFM9_9CORY|nr:hypothetical protein [Corynebacterium hindlerae]QMV85420.1 hypothetical protein HW450_01250 [Corynebacterium hindlerae]QTH58702.1 hypothetical protein J5O04_07560 [Corynebacterium hindlerae]